MVELTRRTFMGAGLTLPTTALLGRAGHAAAPPTVSFTFDGATPRCVVNGTLVDYTSRLKPATADDAIRLDGGNRLQCYRPSNNLLGPWFDAEPLSRSTAAGLARGWQFQNYGAPKKIVSTTETTVTIRMSPDASGKYYGGVRTAGLADVRGPVMVSGHLGMTSTSASSKATLQVGWGTAASQPIGRSVRTAELAGEPGQFMVRLERPPAASCLMLYVYNNDTTVLGELDVTLGELQVNSLELLPEPTFVDGSAGDPGQYPNGWSGHSFGAKRSLTAVDRDFLTMRMSQNPGSSFDFGGMRTADRLDPGSETKLTVHLSLKEVPEGSDFYVNAAWWTPETGVEGLVQVVRAGLRDNPDQTVLNEPRSFSAILQPPAGPRHLMMYLGRKDSAPGDPTQPLLTVGKVSLERLEPTSQTTPTINSYAAADWTGSRARVVCEPGDYTLLADTVERGLITAEMTTSSDIVLDEAFGGSFTFSKLTVAPAGTWSTTTVPPDARAQPVRLLTAPTAARQVGVAITQSFQNNVVSAQSDRSATPPRLQYATNRHSLSKFHITPTDQAPFDSETQVRSEISTGPVAPFEQDIWTSYWISLDRGINYGWLIAGQWHFSGQGVGPEPELTVSVTNGAPTGHFRLMADLRSDLQDPMVRTKPKDETDAPPAPSFFRMKFARNLAVDAWHHVLYRVRFSRVGAGRFQMWINGVEYGSTGDAMTWKVYGEPKTPVYRSGAGADVPVGYTSAEGPYFKWGLYGTNTVDEPITARYSQVEFGPRSLTQRRARPLHPLGPPTF